MIERLGNSYKDPANAERYKLAALLVVTFLAVVFGVDNALDSPVVGSVYEKEGAVGILLVIGQTLPIAIAFRYPMAALVIIMASFTAHTGLDHDVIWVAQFAAAITFFMAITRGRDRQSLLALLIVPRDTRPPPAPAAS